MDFGREPTCGTWAPLVMLSRFSDLAPSFAIDVRVLLRIDLRIHGRRLESSYWPISALKCCMHGCKKNILRKLSICMAMDRGLPLLCTAPELKMLQLHGGDLEGVAQMSR